MRLGDFFVEIGIKTNKDNVKAIEKTIDSLEQLQKEVKREIELEKELAAAQTEEQKARIKKKYSLEKEIDVQKTNLKQQTAVINNFKDMIKGAIAAAAAISMVVGVVDRMTTSLYKSNQHLMNFSYTTGISIGTLTKYANANVSTNPLATIEGTASSLRNVTQNLWDIQLGRGDVSAYQELSYFSGQAVEPYGKSLEQVIESVRSALKNIPNDVQATNLIQRMGFSPDDLMMLRMTREEFEKTQNVFLSASQRRELERYGKEFNIIHLRAKKLFQEVLIKIFPTLIRILEPIVRIGENLMRGYEYLEKMPRVLSAIKLAVIGIVTAINPLWGGLTMLYLMIDDIVGYFMGKESALGYLLYYLDELKENLSKSFNANPFIQSIKDIGNAINESFNGKGFEYLKMVIGLSNALTSPFGAITGLTGLAFQGANAVTNTYNQTNNLSIMTNNPAVANQSITAVTTNNQNNTVR